MRSDVVVLLIEASQELHSMIFNLSLLKRIVRPQEHFAEQLQIRSGQKLSSSSQRTRIRVKV